ncbi:hypothetical protein [Streptomyces sioyaensis]|uniref:hypothetical protein n=1 Tax=Streptomyces sioyaensis TaxID=67364 RepID=UPI00378825CB
MFGGSKKAPDLDAVRDEVERLHTDARVLADTAVYANERGDTDTADRAMAAAECLTAASRDAVDRLRRS